MAVPGWPPKPLRVIHHLNHLRGPVASSSPDPPLCPSRWFISVIRFVGTSFSLSIVSPCDERRVEAGGTDDLCAGLKNRVMREVFSTSFSDLLVLLPPGDVSSLDTEPGLSSSQGRSGCLSTVPSSVQDGIYKLWQAHMRSAPSVSIVSPILKNSSTMSLSRFFQGSFGGALSHGDHGNCAYYNVLHYHYCYYHYYY